MDIENIDKFIILDNNVNNNMNINCNNNNFHNCDIVEPVGFESNIENYFSNNNTTVLSNDEYYVITPDIEKRLEVDVVMPVSLTNTNNTDSNLGNDNNYVYSIITNPIKKENILFEQSLEVEFFGKKRERKMIVLLIN
jgi:hypothetical protein